MSLLIEMLEAGVKICGMISPLMTKAAESDLLRDGATEISGDITICTPRPGLRICDIGRMRSHDSLDSPPSPASSFFLSRSRFLSRSFRRFFAPLNTPPVPEPQAAHVGVFRYLWIAHASQK